MVMKSHTPMTIKHFESDACWVLDIFKTPISLFHLAAHLPSTVQAPNPRAFVELQ
jgi:hypothetical protein